VLSTCDRRNSRRRNAGAADRRCCVA
jgi:hypothetical protein